MEGQGRWEGSEGLGTSPHPGDGHEGPSLASLTFLPDYPSRGGEGALRCFRDGLGHFSDINRMALGHTSSQPSRELCVLFECHLPPSKQSHVSEIPQGRLLPPGPPPQGYALLGPLPTA